MSWWRRLDIISRLLAATMAGGLIGLERIIMAARPVSGRIRWFVSHRAAGCSSRCTRRVVCRGALDTVRVDPTRMARGHDRDRFSARGSSCGRLTVRGLTTAASIWITAAIGILAGTGLYSAVLIGSVITLGY